MVPAIAETHRGPADRFIVAPAHLNDGVVARAADRFFVVEPDRHLFAQPRGDATRAFR
jgi:PIN domain nuclease of toxin-antitoxin system